jgi:hypothetical protein
MDLAPLLCVVRATERPLLFVIRGLLATIPMISIVFAVSLIGHVDLPVVLLLFLWSLAMRFKKSRPGFRSLD